MTTTRPPLLTLGGIYDATKSVATTYVPANVVSTLESYAARFLAFANPIVSKGASYIVPKVLSEPTAQKFDVPADLKALDALLAWAFATGDAQIDRFLAAGLEKVNFYRSSIDRNQVSLANKVEECKAVATNRIGEFKTFAAEKYEEVRPTIETAKVIVQKKLEEENVAAVISSVKENVSFVAENVAPVQIVLSNLASAAKDDISKNGIRAYALDSAVSLKVQGLEAYAECKDKGTVEGVKALSFKAIETIVAAIDEVKRASAEVAVAESQSKTPTKDEYSSASDEFKETPAKEEYTSADEDEN